MTTSPTSYEAEAYGHTIRHHNTTLWSGSFTVMDISVIGGVLTPRTVGPIAVPDGHEEIYFYF